MPSKPVHRKRNKEASKAAIIQAAVAVFAKNGYDKATYKAISEISGLNESLITRYFGSKMGLAVATVNYVKNECFKAIKATEPRETFAEEFHAIGTALTQVYKKNVNNIITLFLLIPIDEALSDDISKENLLKFPDADRLKRYQENGEIPADINTVSLLRHMLTLMHSILYFVFLALRLPIKEAERFLHFNIDSFIYGLTKENKSLADLSLSRKVCTNFPYERRRSRRDD